MKAIRVPPRSRTAWSSNASSSGFRKASRNSASIRMWVAFPPAPWASVMRSSLILGLRCRAASMRCRTCCSFVRCSCPTGPADSPDSCSAASRTASSAQLACTCWSGVIG